MVDKYILVSTIVHVREPYLHLYGIEDTCYFWLTFVLLVYAYY
jgi:hypothetical protein